MADKFTLDLPLPPSLNNIYTGRVKRLKSPKYKAWIEEAGYAANLQRPQPIKGSYLFMLELPKAMRGDLDNRLKPALDLLVRLGLTSDDHNTVSVSAVRSPEVKDGRCRVTVEAWP